MSASQRGLSLVELMVGLALALLVIAGAAKAFAGHVDHTRRLLLEARVQQDLRGATELIARDLRRAGHWQEPWSGPPRSTNPYGNIEVLDEEEVRYAYSQDDEHENHVVDSNEQHGYRVEDGTLKAVDGGAGWQPVTDPAVVTVTGLHIAVHHSVRPLGHLCSPACPEGDPACPSVVVREIEVRLQAHAAADAAIVREASERVRVRNDHVTADCP